MHNFGYVLLQVDGAQCSTCGAIGSYENMLMCDGCEEVCHIDCLILPLMDNAKSEWRCPKCIAKVIHEFLLKPSRPSALTTIFSISELK